MAQLQPAPGDDPVPAATPVYRVDLSPDDVGTRVVVRRLLPDAAPGEPPLGDVLGDLLSWEGGVLVVRTRDGREVTVAEDAVVAAKRVPPPPSRPGRT